MNNGIPTKFVDDSWWQGQPWADSLASAMNRIELIGPHRILDKRLTAWSPDIMPKPDLKEFLEAPEGEGE